MQNGQLLAAIDLGSNSFRLEIGILEHGHIRRVEYLKETVRQGNGLDADRMLSKEAMERGWECLARFSERLSGFQAKFVRAVATQTLREAKNRDVFLTQAEKLLGYPIEVISGREEARLIYSGVANLLPQSEEKRLVVDIGGGSTEFVLGTDKVEFAKSVNIGCVRMSERHFTHDLPDSGQVASATEDIDEAIAQAAKLVPITTAKTLIAVAGTATTVAAAALDLPTYDRYAIHLSRIPAEKVHSASKMFLRSTQEERAALGYMHPGRVDVISAGSLVLSRIMHATGATEFVASESDILDGMAWSLAK